MWRNGKDLKMVRPLMPRPISISSSTKHNPLCAIPSSCACCIQNPNFRSWNHPLISEVHTMPLVSSRWNPTPEQLLSLEEMYGRGIRTPSSEQIQQIAAKLRKFGKIEGKNVFYWFQNHKARDRQKKRRQLEELATAGKRMRHADQCLETKSTGLSMRCNETEHPNKLPTPSNCSTPSEASVSMHGAVIAECRKDEWTPLNQKELQQQQQIIKNETCWKLDLSTFMYPSNSTVQTVNAQRFKGQENTDPFGALDHSRVLSLKNDDFRVFEGDGIEENQTLELFPVKRNDHLSNVSVSRLEEILHEDVSIGGTKFLPNEFIEFLPTKK